MNTDLIIQITIGAVVVLIAIAMYLQFRKPNKAEPVKPQTTRTDTLQTKPYEALEAKQKDRLERLAELTEKHHELASQPEHTIQDATIINLKASIKSLEEQKETFARLYDVAMKSFEEARKQKDSYSERLSQANKLIWQRDRIINVNNTEIKRLKDELGKAAFNVKPEFKIGDPIKGRPVPNGKKFIKGTIVGFSRREGNPKLDNGKTVYLDDAFVC